MVCGAASAAEASFGVRQVPLSCAFQSGPDHPFAHLADEGCEVHRIVRIRQRRILLLLQYRNDPSHRPVSRPHAFVKHLLECLPQQQHTVATEVLHRWVVDAARPRRLVSLGLAAQGLFHLGHRDRSVRLACVRRQLWRLRSRRRRRPSSSEKVGQNLRLVRRRCREPRPPLNIGEPQRSHGVAFACLLDEVGRPCHLWRRVRQSGVAGLRPRVLLAAFRWWALRTLQLLVLQPLLPPNPLAHLARETPDRRHRRSNGSPQALAEEVHRRGRDAVLAECSRGSLLHHLGEDGPLGALPVEAVRRSTQGNPVRSRRRAAFAARLGARTLLRATHGREG
eukprot:Rhum_TRINITY_DN312_c0_g1::Rhum_TRINITY_DN312_c0_g1_i1::g.1088::m.1088